MDSMPRDVVQKASRVGVCTRRIYFQMWRHSVTMAHRKKRVKVLELTFPSHMASSSALRGTLEKTSCLGLITPVFLKNDQKPWRPPEVFLR
jgi:hypothetical protein